jgi:hypothetical protein
VKSGQSSKGKILNVLEIFGIRSHTTITMSQIYLPQLLLLLSPKGKSSNSQCCNNSQLDNPNHLCFCPSNPSLCHHNVQRHNPFRAHHCNHCKLYSLPYQKLSLRLFHCKAHQRCKSDASRPFRKTTRLLDHDVQKSRLRMFLLKELQEAAHLKHWSSWDEEDERILINLLMSSLERYLNGLTSPQKK